MDNLCINTIRMLSADAVQKANSGHPGLPMGAAAFAYTLWTRHLRFNPKKPDWVNRDRFVLSAGHGSMLLYSLLHLTGYDLPLDELKKFRQWGSKTPGHPEHGMTPGVETTTGPLGQGAANAVGMALAERFLADRYNKPDHEIIDYRTYALVSDGDLMEGISAEAASFAGSARLGKLTYLYDSNNISIEGSTDLTFTENVGKRFKAYGWHVVNVKDGNDTRAVDKALSSAKKDDPPVAHHPEHAHRLRQSQQARQRLRPRLAARRRGTAGNQEEPGLAGKTVVLHTARCPKAYAPQHRSRRRAGRRLEKAIGDLPAGIPGRSQGTHQAYRLANAPTTGRSICLPSAPTRTPWPPARLPAR